MERQPEVLIEGMLGEGLNKPVEVVKLHGGHAKYEIELAKQVIVRWKGSVAAESRHKSILLQSKTFEAEE
jgi:hypothetical protein